jgi:branched-chain amino acid transport system permease protein
VLLGGLYALFAIGLSITCGVMRLVNIAHGDFLVLAAYLALVPVLQLHMHPFVATGNFIARWSPPAAARSF